MNDYKEFYLNFPPINISDSNINKILLDAADKLILSIKKNSIYRFIYFDYHSDYLDSIDKFNFNDDVVRKYIIEDNKEFRKTIKSKIDASFRFSSSNNISFTKLILKFKEREEINERFIIHICININNGSEESTEQIKSNFDLKLEKFENETQKKNEYLKLISKEFTNETEKEEKEDSTLSLIDNKLNNIDILKITLNIGENDFENLKKIETEEQIEKFYKDINKDINNEKIGKYEKLLNNENFKKSLLHHFIFIDNPDNHFYFIDSAPFKKTDNKNNNAYGGLFSLTQKKLEKEDLVSLIHISDLIGAQISSNTINALYRSSKIKSAIASIMSRNMSHNLGSHVLSTVSTGINDPTDMQYLTKYIQQRQDYIAQITTEFPKWTHSYRFIGQIMRYFYEQRLLLKYIAESEGLTAMEYYPEEADTKQGKLQFIIKNKGNIIVPDESDKRDQYVDKDPLLAIPGGITGVQAFYSILENIVRNAAKHSYSKENDNNKTDGGLQVIIDFEDKETYVEFTVYTNVTSNKGLENNINEKIKKSFIDKKNELIYKNWGIAEIKISAGYLIGADINLIGKEGEDILYNEKENSGIIKSVKVEHKYNENKKIDVAGYRFKINKPKEVLIIYDVFYNIYNSEEKKELKKDLNNNGIYIKDKIPEELDYDFLITNEEKTKRLPIRTLKLDDNIKGLVKNLISNEKETKDFENFKIKLYNKWIESFNQVFELQVMPFDTTKNRAANVSLNGIYDFIKEKFNKSRSEIPTPYKLNNKINEIPQFSEKISEKIKDEIEGHISDSFFSIIKITTKIFKKYNEFIETLPANYRFSNKTKQESEDNSDNEENTKIDKFKENIESTIKDLGNKKITFKTDIENTDNTVILHRHMSFNNCGEALYCEALSGAQSYFNEIKSLSNNYSGKKMLLNIIETAYFKIHIIDERVAEYYFGYSENSIIRKRIDKAGIIVYGKLNNKEIIKNNNSELRNFDWKNNKDTNNDKEPNNEILIIHQGIIDKFKKDFDIEEDEKNNPPKKFKDKYFVTSGRGKPEVEKIPEKAKYIPFSSINTSITKQYPEKMLLIQSLLKI